MLATTWSEDKPGQSLAVARMPKTNPPSKLTTTTQIITTRRTDMLEHGLPVRHGLVLHLAVEGGEHRFQPGISGMQDMLDLVQDRLLARGKAHLNPWGTRERPCHRRLTDNLGCSRP